jgi:hypothetical protein
LKNSYGREFPVYEKNIVLNVVLDDIIRVQKDKKDQCGQVMGGLRV